MIVEVNDGIRLDRGSIPLISINGLRNVDLSTLKHDKTTFWLKRWFYFYIFSCEMEFIEDI